MYLVCCGCTCPTTHTWRPEDNLWSWVLPSIFMWVLEIKPRSPGMADKCLVVSEIHCVAHLVSNPSPCCLSVLTTVAIRLCLHVSCKQWFLFRLSYLCVWMFCLRIKHTSCVPDVLRGQRGISFPETAAVDDCEPSWSCRCLELNPGPLEK